MPTNLHIPTEIDLADFISKEAHDLKAPFNRSLGFIKLVINGMDGPLPDPAREDLVIAFQNSQHALAMMNGLVETARFSRGKKSLVLAGHQVEPLLKGAVAGWRKQSPKEKSVEVTFFAPSTVLLVDEGLIRQGFTCWIAYVAEFVQESAVVDIQVEDQPESCLFTLRSTGKKIQPPPECDLSLYGYVGLQILSLHGGALLRAEEDEQGALVQFTLPKA